MLHLLQYPLYVFLGRSKKCLSLLKTGDNGTIDKKL